MPAQKCPNCCRDWGSVGTKIVSSASRQWTFASKVPPGNRVVGIWHAHSGATIFSTSFMSLLLGKRSFYRVTTSYLPSSLKKLIFSFGTPRKNVTKKTKTLYISKLLFYNPATPRSERKDPPLLLSHAPSHPAPRSRDIQPRGQEPEDNNPAAPRSKRTDPPLLLSQTPPPLALSPTDISKTREAAPI